MDLVPVEHVSEYACEDADFTRRARRALPAAARRGRSPRAPRRGRDAAPHGPRRHGGKGRPGRPPAPARRWLRSGARDVERLQESIRDDRRAATSTRTAPSSSASSCSTSSRSTSRPATSPRRRRPDGRPAQEVLEELTAGRDLQAHPRVPGGQQARVDLRAPAARARPRRRAASTRPSTRPSRRPGGSRRSDPNLQNIPIRTEAGKKIRLAFLPTADDWELVSADYSQIELRLLAHFANDEALIGAFREGARHPPRDRGARLQPEARGRDATARSRAKVINFGLLYGMGPQRVAQETELTLDEAKTFIERYFAAFPKVRGYLDEPEGRGPHAGLRRDDPRPPPPDPRHQLTRTTCCKTPGGAPRGEHADPGLGRRPDQGRDGADRPAPRGGEDAQPPDPAGARRAAARRARSRSSTRRPRS